jgi:hypothetical protein
MRARLMWALLVLAAVFSMHGLNCAAAEQAPGATSTYGSMMAMGHGESVALGTITVAVAEKTPTSGDHDRMAVTATGSYADVASNSHDAGGHSALMHALMVCLAVVAGGIGTVLAALAVWLARRRMRVWSTHVWLAVQVAVDRGQFRLSTPEFSRLCVLRI